MSSWQLIKSKQVKAVDNKQTANSFFSTQPNEPINHLTN
jgi:hypothetical protein